MVLHMLTKSDEAAEQKPSRPGLGMALTAYPDVA